jgi:group I intron endonuclease
MKKELLLRDHWTQEKQRLKFAGIYKITNKFTGEFYVGASQDIFARWNAHLSLIRSGKHYRERMNQGLQESGFTHPLDVFEIEILEKTTALKTREAAWIATLQPSLNKDIA